VDGRKRLHREVMERLASEHASLLRTAIPASAEVERMGIHRTVIAQFAPRSRAARAYVALWREVRDRLEE
jgi:chromosome partitioning protein